MAPPPLPKKAIPEKKRKSQVDDILGAEVDAMAADAFEQLLEPKPKKQKPDPVSAGTISVPPLAPTPQIPPAPLAPLPVVASAIKYTPPRPPADLPPTKSNTMPFKQKRSKLLVQMLAKDENSLFVSFNVSQLIPVPATRRSRCGRLPHVSRSTNYICLCEISRGNTETNGPWNYREKGR